jgi:hypothetical protein
VLHVAPVLEFKASVFIENSVGKHCWHKVSEALVVLLLFCKPIHLSMQKLHLLFIIFNQHILVLDDLLIVFDSLTAHILSALVLLLELLDLSLFQ